MNVPPLTLPANLALGALLLAAPFLHAADAPPAYTLTNLGTLGGDNSYAYAINNPGQIVGATDTVETGVDGFLFTAGKMQDLGKNIDKATAINDAGQIVGWDDTDGVQAFLSTAGRVQRLGDLAPKGFSSGSASRAYGVNRSGQVVGRAMIDRPDGRNPVYHAFLHTNGAMKDLGVLGGGYGNSEARAINDAGLVAGWSEVLPVPAPFPRKPTDIHAFLFADGRMQDLGTLGGSVSCAFGLNAAGAVVGTATLADGTRHAFLRDASGMRDLGTLGGKNSVAHAINTAGVIVGTAWDDAPDGSFADQHAFVYRDGKMSDLNRLVGEPALAAAGLKVLVRALGLNDRGQIVGEARDAAGCTLAFLLTPADGSAATVTLPKPPSGLTPAGKGLQFAKGPPDGPGVVVDYYRNGSPNIFDGLSAVEIDGLQVRPPLVVWSVPLDAIISGNDLKNATTSGNGFAYLAEISGEALASVGVFVTEGGKTRWGSSSMGLESDLLMDIHHRLPAFAQVRAGSFEPRLVFGPPTYPTFVWLKSTTDGNDLIYPVGVEFAEGLKQQIYPIGEFLKIYQKVLKERMPEAKLVMPPVSAANPNVPIPTKPSALPSKVTVLGPADVKIDWDWNPKASLAETSQGCRIAWVVPVRGTDKHRLVVDGVAGLEFDRIADVRFSTDGRQVSYLASTEGPGESGQAVLDGKPGPMFKGFVESLQLSPDGLHTAFLSEPAGKCLLVFDGQPGPVFDYVVEHRFSADGRHFFYLGVSEVAGGGRNTQIVFDGKPGPVIDGEVQQLTFSADASRTAYVVVKGRIRQIFVDGVAAKSYPSYDQLRFSPDGKHFAYVGVTQGPQGDAQVVFDGQPSPSLGEAGWSTSLYFSPDSQHFAYATENQFVLDGKAGAPDQSVRPDWAGDGDTVMYSHNRDHNAYVSSDKDGRDQVVLDGRPGLAFPGDVQYLTLSPDGRHTAFVIEFGHATNGNMDQTFHEGNWEVVVDGQPGPKFDSVGPRFAFSPDGTHVAYAAATAKQWRVYVDGATGPAVDHIIAGPVVCDDGRLEYLALQRDGAATNLVRVTMPGFAAAKP